MSDVLGLVVALPGEAKALFGKSRWQNWGVRKILCRPLSEGKELLCVLAGVGVQNAAFAAKLLLERGVRAVGVVGVSGGTAPELGAGGLIVADGVQQIDGEKAGPSWETAPELAELLWALLNSSGVPTVRGPIATSASPVLSVHQKSAIYARTNALAIDMESSAVACAAARAGCPFFALRAVCDPHDRAVPKELSDALSETGAVRPAALLRSLCRRPSLFSEIIALRSDFNAALGALETGWRISLANGEPLFRVLSPK